MPLSDLLVPEFDTECAITRTVLERVPDEHIEWKPHPKSFAMGHLAQLIARIPGWVVPVIKDTELDIAPVNRPPGSAYSFEKVATLLEELDRNVAQARPLIAGVTDEELQVPWTLKAAGHAVLTQPRYMILRTQTINHLVHHRAQLSVYLRLVDQPLPEMYGPTADTKRQ